jgi:cobalt-zinc-cadmium efflux system outer membrane protein
VGFGIDQTIVKFGKLKLAAAAAERDLRNAELALRRARSDLSTQVRNAYFGVLVARETVRVNKALARFTDEIYRLQTGYLQAGVSASYEPATIRALAYTARLSYQQSIATYIFSWMQLVSTIGLRKLPLSDVAGRVDAAIPYYDYDHVLAHVLNNHTDVLAARNGLDKARYNLKLAQITPFPNVDINVAVLKELSLPPKQFTHTLSVGVPLPIWDQNKGNIIAAEAALVRATEEPHRVETNLTNLLATAYLGYKNNLNALESYRLYILPDQIRTYRGILARRQIDPLAAFADLVTAQQTLASNVTTYLGILSSLWSSVVSVADLLQTDDLFQLGKPRVLPPLPDLDALASWPCCHRCPMVGTGPRPTVGPSEPIKPGTGVSLPVPRRVNTSQPEQSDEGLPLPSLEEVKAPVQAEHKPDLRQVYPVVHAGSQDNKALVEVKDKTPTQNSQPVFVSIEPEANTVLYVSEKPSEPSPKTKVRSAGEVVLKAVPNP